MRQPVHEQGVLTGQLVLALLRGDEAVERAVTVPTRLVVRRTTGPARGA